MSTVTRSERTRTEPPKGGSAPEVFLDNGDRLSAEEYDRIYEQLPDVRAELIEGVVYVSSPVSLDHGPQHAELTGWAFVYKASTPGLGVSSDGTVHLDPDNRPQPDVHLKIEPTHGGRTGVTNDGKYVTGAPELLIEIAASSASKDLHIKKRAYRRNQVWEYIVWRVFEDRIDWFVLHDGRYRRLKPTAEGILKSERFPGLWLDTAALVRRDSASVLRVLNEGIASPEHTAFVAQLAETAAKLATPMPVQEPRS